MRVYCPQCGTAIDTQTPSVRCPSCTTVFQAPQVPAAAPPRPQATQVPPAFEQTFPTPTKTAPGPSWGGDPRPSPGWTSAPGAQAPMSALAVVSLVSGLLCCIPCVAPITALVTGFLAMRETGPGQKNGRPLAIAGMVLGSLGLLLNLLSVLQRLAQ